MGKILKFAAVAAIGIATAAIGGLAVLGAGYGVISGTTFWAIALTAGTLALKVLSPSISAESAGTQIKLSGGPAEPREYVYGKRRTGGTLAHHESTGSDNDIYWMVVVVASHEINAFTKYFIEDKEVSIDGSGDVTTAPYNGFVSIYTHLGTDAQTVDTDLDAASTLWTTNHRLRGCAYVVVKATYSQDVFPTGKPNMGFEIEGKKVWDTRTSTTVYSTNPALHWLDYMTDDLIGPEAPLAAFNTANTNAAANTCEETVETVTNRYTSDGIVPGNIEHSDVIEIFENAMAGQMSFTGGEFQIHPGEWVVSSESFDEDDIKAPFRVIPAPSRKDLVNGVHGLFIDPNQSYQPQDYPPKTDATAETEDGGGGTLWLDMDLPFTTDHKIAQRIAKARWEQHRRKIAVEMTTNLRGLSVKVMDTITVTHANYGFSAKTFRVREWTLSLIGEDELGVTMVLEEEDSTVWDWLESSDLQTYGTPSLPTFFSPFGVDIAIPFGTSFASVPFVGSNGITVPGLKVGYSTPSAFIQQTQAQYKLNSEAATAYRPLPAQSLVGPDLIAFPAVPESWDVRLRNLSIFGTYSPWATVSGTTVPAGAADATAGANWNTNLTGQPQNVVNLVRDPFMEGADADIFGTLDADHNTEADSISVYPNMLRMTGSGVNNNSDFIGYIPVEPGDILFFQYALRRNASVEATPADAGIYFQYVDAAKGSAVASLHIQDRDDVGTAAWTLFNGQDTVPAGKFFVRMFATNRANHTAGAFFLAAPVFYRATNSRELVDLAVSTSKLNALAVTSAKLGANAVIAGKIAANAVDKGEIITNATSLISFAEKTTPETMTLNTSWQDVAGMKFTSLTTEGGVAELMIAAIMSMTMSSRDPDTFQVDVRVVRGATPTEVVIYPAFSGKPAVDITDSAEPEPWYAPAGPVMNAASPGTTEDWQVQARLQNPKGGTINQPDNWIIENGSFVITELMKG